LTHVHVFAFLMQSAITKFVAKHKLRWLVFKCQNLTRA